MSKDGLRQIVNLIAVLGALVVNILANALPFNGLTTGEISDRFDVYFVPAGYVFSIWGLIYIGWIAFTVFQFLPSQKSAPRMRALGYWFALSCLCNAAWLFAWHYEQFGLSVIIMLALLATLIVSYVRMNVSRTAVGSLERWTVDIPFGVYLGWVSVATIANITSYLNFIGWDGFGIDPQLWAVIMLAVASLLGILVAVRRHDAAYLAVFAWAFAGIAVRHLDIRMVAYAAWFAALLAAGLAMYSIVRQNPAAAAR